MRRACAAGPLQILALAHYQDAGDGYEQDQQARHRDAPASALALQEKLCPVCLGDQEPVGAEHGARHAQRWHVAVIHPVDQAVRADSAAQHLGGQQFVRGNRQPERSGRVRAMTQLVEVEHLFAFAAEQQDFGAGAGHRPGLQHGREIGARIHAQDDDRRRAGSQRLKRGDKVDVHATADSADSAGGGQQAPLSGGDGMECRALQLRLDDLRRARRIP